MQVSPWSCLLRLQQSKISRWLGNVRTIPPTIFGFLFPPLSGAGSNDFLNWLCKKLYVFAQDITTRSWQTLSQQLRVFLSCKIGLLTQRHHNTQPRSYKSWCFLFKHSLLSTLQILIMSIWVLYVVLHMSARMAFFLNKELRFLLFIVAKLFSLIPSLLSEWFR